MRSAWKFFPSLALLCELHHISSHIVSTNSFLKHLFYDYKFKEQNEGIKTEFEQREDKAPVRMRADETRPYSSSPLCTESLDRKRKDKFHKKKL